MSSSRVTGPRRLRSLLTEEEAFGFPPPRRTLCPKYEECLELAAARLWRSFTCRGCFYEELILSGRLKERPAPEGQNLDYVQMLVPSAGDQDAPSLVRNGLGSILRQ